MGGLVNLQSLINGVAKTRPKNSGIVAVHSARLTNASDAVAVLCDTSASMAEIAGSKPRIAHLHEAIDSLAAETVTIAVEFNSIAREFPWRSGVRFSPSGGTDLAAALCHLRSHRPRRTIVISDGEPQGEAAALAAAKSITGRIDVIFVGDERNTRARDFLLSLARSTGGTAVSVDLAKLGAAGVAAKVRGYLQ